MLKKNTMNINHNDHYQAILGRDRKGKLLGHGEKEQVNYKGRKIKLPLVF